MEQYTQDFINAVRRPSRSYGEVPFYWWTGEKLNKERLTSQLEALADKGVAGVQINYAHLVRGGEDNLQYGCHGRTIPGDPVTFSDEWWEFFTHAAAECQRLGMGIGVGDYTLAWIGNGFFTDRIAEDESMQAHELSCEKSVLTDKTVFDGDTLAIVLYTDEKCSSPVVITDEKGLSAYSEGGLVCYIVRLKRVPLSINPMHPQVGKKLVDIYFKEFLRRLPEELHGSLNYFFQDELSFGCNENLIWDDNLRNTIEKEYGYDPLGFIPHLFYNLSSLSPKIRLDVTKVRTRLAEEGYFRPVFDFHNSRGMIYGCDQSSRGKEPTEFTDYFSTVRWFTAPGNDTPGRAADMIKVKVNSSIAHLYKRPRTWLEGYHSSGWGTTLESITGPTGDNFIYGANLLNLHGLYYTTNGGFFEWAPPDFHFRMPYWDDEEKWLKKYTRLAQLLTTGNHRCDAAVFYPTASCTADISKDKAIEGTFSAAEYLFSHGVDFDFIDNDSLLRAEVKNGRLCVADEEYKVLVFAFNDTIRYNIMPVIRSFLDCGGVVAFVGFAPSISDRAGADDSVFEAEINELLSNPNCSISANNEALLSFINRRITRLFQPDSSQSDKIYSLCRKHGKDSLFYLRYADKDCVCRFEAEGSACLIDVYNNKIFRLGGALSLDGMSVIKLPPDLPEDILILFTDSDIETDGVINTSSLPSPTATEEILLNDDWRFSVIPTLDNTYGDFYKPAGGKIGIQARFFDVAEVKAENEIPKKYTYTNLPYCHTMDIKRIEAHGVAEELASAIVTLGGVDTDIISFREKQYRVENLMVHDRYGIILQDGDGSLYEQGYHGLKGRVFDDNFFFTDDSVFITQVYCEEQTSAFIELSGAAPDILYVGESRITDFTAPVRLCEGRNPITAVYLIENKNEPYRNSSDVKRGGIYLRKTENASTMGYELAKSDFGNEDYFHNGKSGLYVYTFRTAPGFNMLRCNVFGEVVSAYNNDVPMFVLQMEKGDFGGNLYEIRTGNISRTTSEVRLYVKTAEGLAFTGAIPSPIDLFCTEGVMSTGDLSKADSALVCFSGKFVYSGEVELNKESGRKYELVCEDVGATLRIEVNGTEAAVLTYAPFKADITEFIQNGRNNLKLTVSNTLCNHYSTIPSRYSNFPQDAKSGLIGDVRIIIS